MEVRKVLLSNRYCYRQLNFQAILYNGVFYTPKSKKNLQKMKKRNSSGNSYEVVVNVVYYGLFSEKKRMGFGN